jgi:hypothetical protein
VSGIHIGSAPNIGLSGEVSLLFHDAGTGRLVKEVVHKNLVVDTAFQILPWALGRDPNKHIEFISIGTGGDYQEQPAGPPIDTGTRNPATVTDQGTRIELFRAAIVTIEFTNLNAVRFYSILQADESNSANIDEFALLASDGTCFSHEVNDANPAPPNRAIKYTKNNGLIVVVRWTLNFFRCDGSPEAVTIPDAGGTPVIITP